eukprot:2465657-Amphidinium_carterae.1
MVRDHLEKKGVNQTQLAINDAMAILPLTKQGLLVEHLAVHRSLAGNGKAADDILTASTIEEKYK